MSGHFEPEHLNHAAISRFALGEATADDRAHIAVCAACGLEVDEFERTLRAFRGSVREWSAEELALSFRAHPSRFAAPRLAALCGTAVILAISVLGLRLSLYEPPTRTPLPSADADAELLMQVRVAVSRPVPRDMEPLLMRP